MTKKLLLLISIASFISLVYITVSSVTKSVDTNENKIQRMPHDLMSGPVIYGANITKGEKGFIVNIKADKLFFENGRILFFETALIKKLVAVNLQITVYIKGKKVIVLRKNSETMQPNLNTISINNPQILFINIPFLKKKIDKVIIYLKDKSLILFTNKEKITFKAY